MGPVATPQVTAQCLTLGAGGDKGSRGVMARCLRLQNGYTLEANGRPGNNIIEFRATTYSASEQPRDLPAVLGRPPPYSTLFRMDPAPAATEPPPKNKRAAGPSGGDRARAPAPGAGALPAGLGGLCGYGNTGLD